jgi:hypothetical protein
MAEQEYYVRKPDSENARGPFDLEKLMSLAEAGQIDRQSLYYDEKSEGWKSIGGSQELCAKLFPEKTKLSLKKKGAPAEQSPAATPPPPAAKKTFSLSLKKQADDSAVKPDFVPPPPPSTPPPPPPPPPPLVEEKTTPESAGRPATTRSSEIPLREIPRSGTTVDDLLAAAEGQTDEMAQLREEKKWRDRAVALAMPLMALLMLISGLVLLFPLRSIIFSTISGSESWLHLAEHPRAILGALDLVLALLLGLAVTAVYPVLRLRLMAGLGYLGYFAYAEWVAGSTTGLAEILLLAVFSAGVFVCTITSRFAVMLASGLAALAAIVILGTLWNLPGIA